MKKNAEDIMKKTISLILAATLAATVLASCSALGERVVEGADPYKSSSSDYADEAWLKSRLGSIPDNVTVGTADTLGIDMTDFEDDGYIIRNDSGEVTLCGKTADGLDRAVRAYAKAKKYGNPVADVTYHEGARIERLTIAGRDIADYTVVFHPVDVPKIPGVGRTTGNGEYAAREFVRLVREATGITLPMIADDISYEASAPFVFFYADEAGVEYSDTGYEYKVENGNVFFRGSGIAAGCSNGVYIFFERECDWLGLTYGDSILAEAEHIDIPEGTAHTGELTFDAIDIYGLWGVAGSFRNNNPTSDYKGMVKVACHGLQTIRLETDEVSSWQAKQICYTNGDNLNQLYEIFHEDLRIRTEAGAVIGRDLTYIDMAQRDSDDYCYCKDCRAVLKEEKYASGAVVRFANALSDMLNEDFPGVKYLIFAYVSTKMPPAKTKPNDSVYVTYCLDGCCCNHPLNAGKCTNTVPWAGYNMTNDDYCEWLDGWCAICPNVYIWYYKLDGCFAQFNLLNVMYEDIKFFREHGVKGFMLNGDADAPGTGRFEHDMLGAMQWHPDMTKEEYTDLLFRKADALYGDGGAEAFCAEASLINESTHRKPCFTGWVWTKIDRSIVDYEYFGEHSDKVLDTVEGLIEDAPSRDAELYCKRLSLVLIYEGCVGRYEKAVAAGDTELVAKLEKQYADFIERSVEVGYNLDKYQMGIGGAFPIARTLAEESGSWADTK